MRTFRCIYIINYYNSASVFLLKSAKNCQNDTIFDNLRTITQEGDMKTRQMTPLFSSIFQALTV